MLFIFFSVTIHKDKAAQSNFTIKKSPKSTPPTSAYGSTPTYGAENPHLPRAKNTFKKGIPPSSKCIDGCIKSKQKTCSIPKGTNNHTPVYVLCLANEVLKL